VYADLCLIIADLACDLGELPSELPFLLKEAGAYVHFGAFNELKLVVLLHYVWTYLPDVKHLVVIDVQLLPDRGRWEAQPLRTALCHAMDLAIGISQQDTKLMKPLQFV